MMTGPLPAFTDPPFTEPHGDPAVEFIGSVCVQTNGLAEMFFQQSGADFIFFHTVEPGERPKLRIPFLLGMTREAEGSAWVRRARGKSMNNHDDYYWEQLSQDAENGLMTPDPTREALHGEAAAEAGRAMLREVFGTDDLDAMSDEDLRRGRPLKL